MSKFQCCFIAALLVVAEFCSPVVANEVLQRIPANALGFFVVRNVADCSEKCEQLAKPFNMTFPAPLPFAKLVTGLGAGLDVSGDLVIAHLPGATPNASSIPLVLLPVENYIDFAASIHADPSGDICRITLLGEDILAGQHGAHAMLMNVEDEPTMERVLALGPRSVAALSPLNAWIEQQDAALILMAPGVEQLSQWRPASARQSRLAYDFTLQPSFATQLFASISGPVARGWLRRHVELAAIGISVDDKNTVQVGEQLLLKENSPLAKLAPQSVQQPAAMLGLSDKSCVVAAGGPLAPGWGKQLARYLRQLEEAQAAQTGLEKVSSEQWDDEEQAFRLLLENVRSCSAVMLPGDKGEPLMGNFFGVATVDDVDQYLASLTEVVKTWNDLNKLSTDEPQPEIELVDRKIAGHQAYEIVLDIGTAMADPNVPLIQWMLEVTVGGDGKLRTKLLQVDQETFVFGIATDEQLQVLLQRLEQNQATAPPLAEVQTTLQLMEPAAPWKMLIQPQGGLKWIKRVVNEYLVLLEHGGMSLPPMPNSPPLGLTINWSGRRLACDLVCPADTWQTLAKYYDTANPQ
ncbi:MAG: hypothetical protein ACR2NM_04570 [Bythopirellula sp.]